MTPFSLIFPLCAMILTPGSCTTFIASVDHSSKSNSTTPEHRGQSHAPAFSRHQCRTRGKRDPVQRHSKVKVSCPVDERSARSLPLRERSSGSYNRKWTSRESAVETLFKGPYIRIESGSGKAKRKFVGQTGRNGATATATHILTAPTVTSVGAGDSITYRGLKLVRWRRSFLMTAHWREMLVNIEVNTLSSCASTPRFDQTESKRTSACWS